MKNQLIRCCCTVFLFITTQVSAALVEWRFSGEVIEPEPSNVNLDTYFSDTTDIAIGDFVEGSISFDPTTPGSQIIWPEAAPFADGQVGDATGYFADFASTMLVEITFHSLSGLVTYSFDGLGNMYNIENWNSSFEGSGNPPYDVLSKTTSKEVEGGSLASIFRLLAPAFTNVFSLDGFEAKPPSLSDLDIGRLNLLYFNDTTGQNDSLFVRFDSLTVPEPGSLWLIWSGMLLGFLRRRR